jgi:acetyltransferase-like isoleucine patch superfamily enzyme
LRAQLLYRPLWWFKQAIGFGPKVHWGERVCFLSSVRAAGPGHIYLGNDSIFDSKPDLYTQSLEAQLKIGSGVFVNGTRFGCSREISVGRNSILADARLMDTDFHSLSRDRHSPQAVIASGPVVLEENVWLGAGSAVLKGVTIGKDSVIAFGSVVTKDVLPGHIYGGNPAKAISEIP